MHVLWSQRFSFAPWFLVLSRIGIVAACAILVFLGYVIFSISDSPPSIREGALHMPSWDFRKIEKGLVALRDASREETQPLLRALQVRARNTRPDVVHNHSNPQMLLEIKGSPETRAVASGQKLFLHWEPSHAGGKVRNGPPAPLNWSAENSCFTLTPFTFPGAQDANAVFFTVSLTDEAGQAVQETPFLIESAQDNIAFEEAGISMEPWLESLRSANFWTKDAFLEIYGTRDRGGEVYKIGITTKEGMNILQVREGDYLVFQEDNWVTLPLGAAAEKPLAQVFVKEGGRLYLRVWDSTGFLSGIIPLSTATPSAITSKIEADFLSPRLRNSSEVSCLLGQRRVVLKPGDWWIKEENRRWRSLKKMTEIDDFLAFKCKGEIFVVDNLDKSQGKSMLKGRLFDRTRQFAQAITLPVAEGRTSGVVKHHKKDARKKSIRESTRKAPIPIAGRGEARVEVRAENEVKTHE